MIIAAIVVIAGYVATRPAGTQIVVNNDNHSWRLLVDGMVDRPLELSLDDLLAMPSVLEVAKVQCVDDPAGNLAITSVWTGVPLSAILEEVRPSAKAVKVAFYASDGYSSDLSLETAMEPNVLVAYMQDNKLITYGQQALAQLQLGFASPRLVVPGEWGYKWITMLQHIEVVDYDYHGVWESQGYPDNAMMPQ